MAKYNLVQCVFNRDDLSADEDVAVITMHIRQTVQNSPDILPITTQGRDAFANRVYAWWQIVHAHVTDKIEFHEMRFYDVPDTPGADMGDPVQINGVQNKGTSTSNALPPQCAISVTFKTDQRKTWGRFYIPGFTESALDATGRLQATICQEIADATHGLTDRSVTAGALTVFSRKGWTHHDPQTIQVDDIVDVIRSRRFSMPKIRATHSAG